jgi:hypothetical protein
MSLSTNQVINQGAMNGALLEKVILGNDLSGLTSLEKVQYVKEVCHTIGLNPVTKPIQLMKFEGKEIPYFTKDATEQLRKINKVSISNIDTKIIDGTVYVVTATATMPDGRQDSSTGVTSIGGLKGTALGNAMMKAETKAKRRVTLSICGLGFIDESEVDSIPNVSRVDINQPKLEVINTPIVSDYDIDDTLLKISQTLSLAELETTFVAAYKELTQRRDKEGLRKLIEAKDKKKSELNMKEFNEEIDAETGEVTNE